MNKQLKDILLDIGAVVISLACAAAMVILMWTAVNGPG